MVGLFLEERVRILYCFAPVASKKTTFAK